MSMLAYKSYVYFTEPSKCSVKVYYVLVKCSILQDPTSNLSLEYQNSFIWLLTKSHAYIIGLPTNSCMAQNQIKFSGFPQQVSSGLK